MYCNWTDVVLWRIFLELIWNLKNVLMMENYWVWAQSWRSKSSIWVVTFRESIFLKLINNNKKCYKKFYSKLIRCLGTYFSIENLTINQCYYQLFLFHHYIKYVIYIFKAVISVSDCLSDHNSGTPGPICLKFWFGNSGDRRECS